MAGAPKIALNFETVASIVAMIVGVSALFAARDQAQIMRKEQHPNLLPVLNVSAGFMADAEQHDVTISIRNGRNGPAVIKSSTMESNGRKVEDRENFSERFLPAEPRSAFETIFDSTIGILAAGDIARGAKISWPRIAAMGAAVQSLRAHVFASDSEQMNFGLCYCSLFDRCWRTSARDSAGPVAARQDEDAGEDVVAQLLQTLLNGGL